MNINVVIATAILVINSFGLFAQSDSTMEFGQNPTCEDAVKIAQINFNKGIYEKVILGMVLYDDWEFEEFYKDYILDKYGITIKHEGCVITEYIECYANKMNDLILNKFGKDIYENARQEALVAFEKMLDEADSSKVLFFVDQRPTFVGGNDSLVNYLKNNINLSDTLEGKARVRFIVEKDGSLSNIKIKEGFDKATNKKILNTMRTMPKWVPALHHDREVRVMMILPIILKKKQDFDKVVIEYSYHILNERIDYIVTKDSIVVKEFIGNRNHVYSNGSLNNELDKIFNLKLDSIESNICYNDGLITKFTFYSKGEKLKVAYLAGNEGVQMIFIINTLNTIMKEEDYIKMADCGK
jgi:succinate dehydrogenase flavin-adding protein (antitoxin of CptAB toxin-antitoxin module)